MKHFTLFRKHLIAAAFFGTAILVMPLAAQAAPAPAKTVPQIATEMGIELNEQLSQVAGRVSIIVTTPVNLRNLNESSGLGLQLGEELSHYFITCGYRVQEVRKGAGLFFDEENGEMLLTRNPEFLASTDVSSSVVMVGTYIRTNRSVRVNIKLLHTPTNEVLAMSSATIPLNSEVRSLLATPAEIDTMGHVPSIGTKLNPNGVENTAYNVEPGMPPASEVPAEGQEAPKPKSRIDKFIDSYNQSPPGP